MNKLATALVAVVTYSVCALYAAPTYAQALAAKPAVIALDVAAADRITDGLKAYRKDCAKAKG